MWSRRLFTKVRAAFSRQPPEPRLSRKVGQPPHPGIVQFGDVYLAFDRRDVSYAHVLKGGHKPVAEEDAKPLNVEPIDIEKFWLWPSQDLLSSAFVHMWRRSLEFTYLDVGAHVGMQTAGRAHFARRCGRRLDVYSFEPGESFPLLEQTILLNGLSGSCRAIKVAVSDKPGRSSFINVDAHTPGGTLLPAIESRIDKSFLYVTEDVEVTSIDQFVKDNSISTHLICKIDTEGNDFKVIDGMAETMARRHVLFQIEFLPSMSDTYCDPVERFTALARDHYLFENSPTGALALAVADIPAFVARIREADFPATDVIVIPKNLPFVEDLVDRLLR